MRVDPYSHAPRLPEGPIDWDALFAGSSFEGPPFAGPLELEIGPGRGWFIVERLAADPSVRVVGLEIRRKWATIVDQRLRARGLSHRGRVFAEDARQVMPRLRAASVERVYLHFPDPWWKKRHQKRLVLGAGLLPEVQRILVPGGELFIQTDVAERAEEYESLLAASPGFRPLEASARVADHPFGARSPRERKAMEDGLPIVRLRYRRTSEGT